MAKYKAGDLILEEYGWDCSEWMILEVLAAHKHIVTVKIIKRGKSKLKRSDKEPYDFDYREFRDRLTKLTRLASIFYGVD